MDNRALFFLEKKLKKYPQYDYPTMSRIHPLQTYKDGYFVKREDELGFGISGSKIRKYRTLIPFLHEQGYKEIGVIGNAFSNHTLSLTQLLIENGFTPKLFLKGRKNSKITGNFFYLHMLIDSESITWFDKEEIHKLQEHTLEYIQGGDKRYVIPEGAFLFEAFIGACTLPIDIIRNEKMLNISFKHIFIDSGTGLTAAALLLVFSFLKKDTSIHIMHLADGEREFHQALRYLYNHFSTWLNEEFTISNYTSFFPTLAPSFGSTNHTLFTFIRDIAQNEGFFLDPIYSGKLFYEIKKREEISDIPALIIHSGGALSLSGFQDRCSFLQFF